MKLERATLLAWADAYEQAMPREEVRLLGEVGPVVVARGHYEPDEFVAVARWKTPRTGPRIAANSDADIREITAVAFHAPERLQHRMLTVLDGVGIPTATALLTIAFPQQHTVLDYRVTESLAHLGEWAGTGGYVEYLGACRSLARRLKVDLRTLDRALWQWSKDGLPGG